MKRFVATIGATAVVSAVALAPGTAQAAPASVNHANYQFFVGGPMTMAGVPDVSRAPDGTTVTMEGMGTVKAGPDKFVSGGGTYTITFASGGTASGTWTATQMLSFVNYGSGAAQGTPPNFFGGQAVIKVTLSGVGSSVLQINCTLGTPPPGHSGNEEGIDLRLGGGLTFNEEVSGETLFIMP